MSYCLFWSSFFLAVDSVVVLKMRLTSEQWQDVNKRLQIDLDEYYLVSVHQRGLLFFKRGLEFRYFGNDLNTVSVIEITEGNKDVSYMIVPRENVYKTEHLKYRGLDIKMEVFTDSSSTQFGYEDMYVPVGIDVNFEYLGTDVRMSLGAVNSFWCEPREFDVGVTDTEIANLKTFIDEHLFLEQ